jgi:hydroxyacylglutathione hydrolase
MLHIEPVKAFKDNYLWVFHRPGQPEAVVVDPGDAAPVQSYLSAAGLNLSAIMVTHHHADHIGGVSELQKHWNVPVYGPVSSRIPQVTHPVQEGDEVSLLGMRFRVLAVPGHTLEHIAYFAPEADGAPLLFCGDTLFAAGCGRMFEGTPPVMYASLQKLAHLPADTRVYCTHEYTLSNLNFAQAVLGNSTALTARIVEERRKRDRDQPTLPSTMDLELATNPFLRCQDPAVLQALSQQQGLREQDPSTVFGALRRWKDVF